VRHHCQALTKRLQQGNWAHLRGGLSEVARLSVRLHSAAQRFFTALSVRPPTSLAISVLHGTVR
jgi:hypothetical protein